MSADYKPLIRRFGADLWNHGHLHRADEFLTPNIVSHFTHLPSPTNREGFLAFVTQVRTAFPDVTLTLEDLIAEGDRVMSRVTMRCTHKGELEGIPPTGKVITISAFTVFRLVDGKIAEEWEILDELGMMHQLGLELKPKE